MCPQGIKAMKGSWVYWPCRFKDP